MPISRNRRKKKDFNNEARRKTNELYSRCYKRFIETEYHILVRFAKWVKADYIKKFSWIKEKALRDAINRQLTLKRFELLSKQKKK